MNVMANWYKSKYCAINSVGQLFFFFSFLVSSLKSLSLFLKLLCLCQLQSTLFSSGVQLLGKALQMLWLLCGSYQNRDDSLICSTCEINQIFKDTASCLPPVNFLFGIDNTFIHAVLRYGSWNVNFFQLNFFLGSLMRKTRKLLAVGTVKWDSWGIKMPKTY